MRVLALTVALSLSTALPAYAQVGQWVDKDGTIHIGTPPPFTLSVPDREFRTSTRGARFIAEFIRNPHPSMADSPSNLNILFYGPKLSPAQIMRVLRSSLDAAIAMDSSHDILATGFDGDDDTEPTLSMSDKFKYSGGVPDRLIYLSKSRKVLTWKEYERTH